MIAMILEQPRQSLRRIDRPTPKRGRRRVLVEVLACGVCRTDLHVVDGELREPIIPGALVLLPPRATPEAQDGSA